MRGNKLEKSHIHILQSETLSRESRVTETAQEIVDSIPCNCEWYSYINSCQLLYTLGGGMFYKKVGILLGGCLTCDKLVGVTWRLSDCEELVGVTHRG